ncbi:hypothetical protein [Nostoc sp.]
MGHWALGIGHWLFSSSPLSPLSPSSPFFPFSSGLLAFYQFVTLTT